MCSRGGHTGYFGVVRGVLEIIGHSAEGHRCIQRSVLDEATGCSRGHREVPEWVMEMFLIR